MNRRALSYHMLIHYLLAIFSLVVTFVWLKSVPLAIASALTSIFLDTDHVFDFWLGSGFSLNPRKFIRETLDDSPYFARSGKILILFHSWELLVLAIAASFLLQIPQLGISFAVGFVPHLLWDQMTFASHPLTYSFFYRLSKKFAVRIFGYE